MDELKIGSKLARGIIAKLIKRETKKQIGCEIDFQLNDLNIKLVDGGAQIHLNADATVDKDGLTKILAKAGL